MAVEVEHAVYAGRFGMTVCLFAAILLFSVSARLQSEERTLIYFILFGLGILVLAFQTTYAVPRHPARIPIVLGELGVLLTSEVLLKTLLFPYYIGNTDIAAHEEYVAGIFASGHIGNFMGVYEFVPFLHVLSAMISQVCAVLVNETAILMFFGVAGFALPFLFYSIARSVTKNTEISLIISFLGPFGYLLLNGLSQGVTSVLAFLLFIFIVYVSIGLRLSARSTFLAMLFAVGIVLTHQVSIPVMIVSLLVIVYLARKCSGGESRTTRHVGIHGVYLLAGFFLAYQTLFLMGFYKDIFVLLRPSTGVSLPVLQPTSFGSLIPYFILTRAPSSVFLFFAFLAVLAVWGLSFRLPVLSRSRSWALVSTIGASLYVPDVASRIRVVNEFVLGNGRTTIQIELLVVFLAALAIGRTGRTLSAKWRILIPVVIVVIVLGSVVSEANTLDTSALGSPSQSTEVYFDEKEMAAFYLVETRSANTSILADFVSITFLAAHGVPSQAPIAESNSTLFFRSGSCVFLRTSGLMTKTLLFPQSGSTSLVPQFVVIRPTNPGIFESSNNVLVDSGGPTLVYCVQDSWIGGKG